MQRLKQKNEDALRAILKLKEAGLHEVNACLGFDAKECINSLKRCNFIEVTRTVSLQMSSAKRKNQGFMRDMHLYAITDRGRDLLQNLDFPPARKMKALKVPVVKAKPQPEATPAPPQLHKMEYLTTPIKTPGVNVMMAEIVGREVKITYGTGFEYEVYRPEPDRSRNYTPRPLRSLTSMA